MWQENVKCLFLEESDFIIPNAKSRKGCSEQIIAGTWQKYTEADLVIYKSKIIKNRFGEISK
jgi:hypothetical protein